MKFTPFRWWNHSTLPVEALSGLIAWYWTIVLLAPGNTFIGNPVYKTLIYICPLEWVWACVMLFAAILHTLTVCFSVNSLRYISLGFSLFIWIFLTVTFFMSAPFSVSPGVYGLLSAFTLWAWYRSDKEQDERI